MNIDLLGSEFSSGCESGWTLYLEQSYLSQRALYEQQNSGNNGNDDEVEEEDLSMVSDASSGPPHFQEEDEYAINNQNCGAHIDAKSAKNGGKREKNTKEYPRRKVQEQQCLLDDTASSPMFNFASSNLAVGKNQPPMENILDFSQGYSSTHFERKSKLKDHFGIFQTSVSGTKLQQNQWFEEKRVGMR